MAESEPSIESPSLAPSAGIAAIYREEDRREDDALTRVQRALLAFRAAQAELGIATIDAAESARGFADAMEDFAALAEEMDPEGDDGSE